MWLDRIRAPWRDLPEHLGPWRTVVSRFYPWHPQGILGHLMAESQRLADAAGELDWRLHHVNGTVVCATRTPPVQVGVLVPYEHRRSERGGAWTPVHDTQGSVKVL